ncbi:MAG: hypothetical protein KF866_07795 [Phycisphaeraceae bacterium]|nr:hypothetical protein [Phycisphaeraceae bacterium]
MNQTLTFRRFLQGVIGMSFLVFFFWGIFALAMKLADVPLQDSALAVIAVGGVGWLIKSSYESSQERRRRNAERKLAEYQEFLDFVNETISHGSAGLSSDRVLEFRSWSMGLALFASDEVIVAWNRFRTGTEGRDTQTTAIYISHLLLAMRKDCGMHHTKLKGIHLLTLFLNSAADDFVKDRPTVSKEVTSPPTH